MKKKQQQKIKKHTKIHTCSHTTYDEETLTTVHFFKAPKYTGRLQTVKWILLFISIKGWVKSVIVYGWERTLQLCIGVCYLNGVPTHTHTHTYMRMHLHTLMQKETETIQPILA